MLAWRIISSIVGIPVILGAFYLGGWYATGLVLITALMGAIEYIQFQKKLGLDLSFPLVGSCSALLILSARFNQSESYYFTACILLVLTYQLHNLNEFSMAEAGSHLLAIFYIGWLISYAIRLERWNYELVFWLFIINWSSDIMAYFVGRLCGRHLLAPRISPKKTWEGAAGSCLGGILGAFIGWYLFVPEQPIFLPVVLGLALGIGGQVGDLVESLFKRSAQVKDSGNIIPGHGGILDRIDSLLFNLPLMYYILVFYTSYSGTSL